MDRPVRILHVDDDSDFGEMVATFLEREDDDFDVETVTSAQEGLDGLGAVDCVVSDYDMPGLDGIEFLETVREEHPDLPFILFTGKGSEEVASEAIAKGATDYLQKGSGGTEQYELLANRVRNAVEQYRSERQLRDTISEYTAVFENARSGLLLVGVEGETFRYRHCNERMCELTGLDRSEIVGHTPGEAFGAGNAEKITAAYRECVDERRSVEYTITLDLPVGEVVRECEVTPVSTDGPVEEMVVVVRDITERRERQRELEATAARLEALFENAPDMINVHDIEGNLLDPNPRFCERTGYSEAELTGMKVWDIDVRADPERSRSQWERMEPGERLTHRGEFRRADGSTFPVEVHVRRLEPPSDDQFVASSRDISERIERERERERRQRELERYETIVETSNDVAFVVDEDWTVEYVNRRIEDYVDVMKSALEGKRVMALAERFVAEDSDGDERFAEALRRMFAADDPEAASERVELTLTLAGGKAVVFEYQLSPLVEDGETSAVVVTMRDVTERKGRERALAATSERLDTVVSNVPIVLFALDADGRFTLSEGRGLDRLGLEPGEVVGESVFEVYGDHPDIVAAVERALDGEAVTATQELSDLVYETAYQPVFDDCEVSEVIGVAVDITDRRERERELERKNERLDEFASVVSHDLRSPLNVASGRLELLAEECDSEHIDEIDHALDRMDELVDDLLTLARRGERVSDTEPVSLAEVVEQAWRSVETADATLAVEADRTVEADRGQLQQLVENLLQNAVEHGSTSPDSRSRGRAVEASSPGGPERDGSVTVTVGDCPGGFYVADDGPGIPADEREQVFESGYSTATDGTGFGLAIVSGIVDAHGWTIEVTESDAGGARFEITGLTA